MGNKFSRKRSQIDDRYTRPQGLYQHKDVDQKKLRRLIIESKLAPCYPGGDEPSVDLDECPICFLHYPSLNRSKCCTKGICTECFLQVKSPHSARPTHVLSRCPFCKTPSYAVEYKGAKTQEEKGVEQVEEQKVIEAKIRIRRQQEIQDEVARIQRVERASEQDAVPTPAAEENVMSLPSTPTTFPIFSAAAAVDEATSERMSAAERSWNSWTSIDRPAIGYPFAVTSSDAESSPWCQRDDADGSSGGAGSMSSPSTLATSTATATATTTTTTRNSFRLRMPWTPSSCSSTEAGPITDAPLNRDDNFDLDLEEIMLMEAIWQSIQEQNCSEGSFPSPSFLPQQPDECEEAAQRAPSGSGFASAIAALAERRSGAAEAVAAPPADVAGPPADVAGPTTSAAATNDPRNLPPPESFEEQMMLAMALSLAEAQQQRKRKL